MALGSLELTVYFIYIYIQSVDVFEGSIVEIKTNTKLAIYKKYWSSLFIKL